MPNWFWNASWKTHFFPNFMKNHSGMPFHWKCLFGRSLPTIGRRQYPVWFVQGLRSCGLWCLQVHDFCEDYANGRRIYAVQKLFHLMHKEICSKPGLICIPLPKHGPFDGKHPKTRRTFEQRIEKRLFGQNQWRLPAIYQSTAHRNIKIIDITNKDFVEHRKDYLQLLKDIMEPWCVPILKRNPKLQCPHYSDV